MPDPGKPVLQVTFMITMPEALDKAIRKAYRPATNSFGLEGVWHLRWDFENVVEAALRKTLKKLKVPLASGLHFSLETIPDEGGDIDAAPRNDSQD